MKELIINIKDDRIKETFTKLFNKWADLNSMYLDVFDGEEGPYFFSERTNCSMLNAAAYQVDGLVSLVEIPVNRNRTFSEVNSGSGRYDLYLYDYNSKVSYLTETKQSWTVGGSFKQLKKAENQISSIKKGHKQDINLAIVFSVNGNKKVNDEIISNRIEKINNISSEAGLSGFVHYYPEKAKGLRGSDGRIYPGVSILMKVVE